MRFFDKSRAKRQSRARFTPILDVLEVREVLSTLTVLNTLDSGLGSLRDTVAAASSGDTIEFDPSLNGQTITLTSGTIVDTGKDLDIVGPGATNLTISGGGTSGIFAFFATYPGTVAIDVTVSGLTLADGVAEFGAGGAIAAYGANLTVTDDVFLNNAAAQSGGAINANGFDDFSLPANTVTIVDSRFVGNTASFYGGAFQGYHVDLNISGSEFLNSVTSGQGGALITGGGNATITDSTFQGNKNGTVGFFGNTLTVSGSTFRENTGSGGFGGPAINSGGTLTVITSSTFADNSYTTDYFGQGGAVLTQGNTIIDSSRFLNNRIEATIAALGGAVFMQGGVTNRITNTEFTGNEATGGQASGGAVYKESLYSPYNPTLEFSGNTYTGNRAIGRPGGFAPYGVASGGALAIPSFPGAITITGDRFENNLSLALDSPTDFGGVARAGAITASGGFNGGSSPATLTITGATFLNNTAQAGNGFTLGGIGEGGAIGELSQFASVAISGSTFVSNTARSGNGGVPPGTFSFSGALGGAIQTFGQPMTIDGSLFAFNAALGGDGAPGRNGSVAYGGAIANAIGTVTNSTFLGNLAVGGKGGAAVGSGVAGNGGDASGGAIYTGNLTVISSTFVGNVARGGKGGAGGATGTGGNGGKATGGAISFDPGAGSSNVLTVNDSLFTLNLALGGSGGSGAVVGLPGQGLGGAIAILNGSGKINKKTKFVLNRASTSGNNVYGPYTS